MKTFLLALTLALTACLANAKEYHVGLSGSEPFESISAAALVAQPGDTITVHAGTYRERINPPRGGSSDKERIVYRAAKNEEVVIKGSEIVKGWEKQPDGSWKVTLPNSFFGDYNPYSNVIAGDWFTRQGRDHHTGEVYINEQPLYEEVSIEKLTERELSWYCEGDEKETRIWANFGTSDPNKDLTEINVRPTCFYPEEPNRNYITVSGFIIRHGATQWAAPTAEQGALIGTHWSKGWIIENNIISDSKCVGLTLGKYGDEFDNTSANLADGYVKTIERAMTRGWTKETIGSHIVRNNTIYNCGAAGICGSLGGIFSELTGNHVYNINIDKPFTGHEMAGIKLHAPIDTLIKNNRIHHTSRGIWLDWMTQGTRVTGNLLYDNGRQDIYIEVNHGPYVVDNNFFLTDYSLKDHSQGGAFIHNLFLGKIEARTNARQTPYHKEHSTDIAGLSSLTGGDNRFYNNVFAGSTGLEVYANSKPPMLVDGNVYLSTAKPLKDEKNNVIDATFGPRFTVTEEQDGVYLTYDLPEQAIEQTNTLVTTKTLGKTRTSGHQFKNPDGSALLIDTDYFGKKRNKKNPTPGPYEPSKTPRLRLKVW